MYVRMCETHVWGAFYLSSASRVFDLRACEWLCAAATSLHLPGKKGGEGGREEFLEEEREREREREREKLFGY